MKLKLSVLAKDTQIESYWATAIQKAVHSLDPVSLGDLEIEAGPLQGGTEPGHLIFVDGAMPDLEQAVARIDRKGRAVFLIVDEKSHAPGAWIQGAVDDVILHPFRALDILSKIRHYQQLLMWDEVHQLNASFKDLMEQFKEDLSLAERLQKSKLPTRFDQVKGFKVWSRYLAGMRAGGDFFDLADSKDGSMLSLVLSDSSSYGLSSAVLSVLMKVAIKLSGEEIRSCEETVRRISDEILLTLGEKDKLSLFYGVVSKKDFKMRYVNLGTNSVFLSKSGSDFVELPGQGIPISHAQGYPKAKESELMLGHEDRLALLSDGFVDAAGGASEVCRLLNQFRSAEGTDSLNELTFRVKRKFAEGDDFPQQDCSAMILDVNQKILRLM